MKQKTVAALTGLLLVAVVTASATARGQAAPRNTSQPQITGTPRVGQAVTTSTGGWSGATSFAYQWMRCDSTGATNCSNIGGATGASYKLTNAERNRVVEAIVTAKNASGSAAANSAPVGPIAANVVPQSTAAPSVAGKPVAGEPLTANRGGWTGWPDSYSYQWQQCDSAGAGCNNVSGATGQVFTARNEDVGHTIRVRVTARNPKGSNSATSGATDVIAQPTGSTATIPVTSVSLPNRLGVSVQFEPGVVRSNAPFVARFKVTESKNRTVSGALVYAIALPYGLVRPAAEATTGADGVATITFQPTSLLPRKGSIQFFVRVRKGGEDLLAGVSNRRLVQVLVRR